ncbi:HEPN domain-containing protein [Granulicoccus phenolivorans]|uniref:HEPN domain-containing protein n=1 Tax=Granulicoccus phenolivorans TaxID=266854 RepID=UPI00047B129C|nr:HEPN domain-containing protein [Granulicoccus phenolivorans]
MDERGESGTFWLASTPERTSRGDLTIGDEKWRLDVDSALFDTADGAWIRVGDNVRMDSGNPTNGVLDHQPRVVHGRLDDGGDLTLFDARLEAADLEILFPSPRPPQTFEGWRILHGACVPDQDSASTGVRWTMPHLPGLRLAGTARCKGGTLTSYTHENLPGICLETDQQHPIRTLADLTPNRITSFLSIATGYEVVPVHREIRLPDGTWCRVGIDRPVESRSGPADFVTGIDLERLASWTDQSEQLGPLPFMPVADLSAVPVQVTVQVVATALEGLHRRTQPDEKPFGTLSKGGIRRAVKAAVTAGTDTLEQEGWQDQRFAQTRFNAALGHVGEMSYAERLRALLTPVNRVAPGLFGPSLNGWIKRMKDVRNVQSHQLDEHDAFGEKEIDLYVALNISGRWALRLALLQLVLSKDDINDGLGRSNRFRIALANIDASHVWDGFSCAETFRAARSAGSQEGGSA